MKVFTRTKGMNMTQALENYLENKVKSFVNKYFPNNNNIKVQSKLKLENSMHVAEVNISFYSYILRGESSSDDMYSSIDQAFCKIDNQYRRHKTRLNKKNVRKVRPKELATENNVIKNNEEMPLEVLRRKTFILKPMLEEEAILQMDLLGHNFYIYLDDKTSNIHVVYKRKKDHYGVIETEI